MKNVLHRLDTKQYPIVDLLYILTFCRLFTKRENEALLADAGLVHFPEMVPNRQIQRNYFGLFFVIRILTFRFINSITS